MTPADTKQLTYSVLTDAQKKRFEETLELDFSFGIKGLARFRCNMFNQRGAVGAVYRLIPEKIRSFQELGLPPVLAKLAERPRGLVLVTGPTGSGKSTTLAAMIDKINKERHDHILTIEDPIEFVHQHQSCLVNQREVHSDTQSFSHGAARGAARGPGHRADRRNARPRDGGSGAAHRRDRPLDVRHAAHELGVADDQPHHRHLPGEPAGQIRTQLSLVLEGIVCQALLPKIGGGRVVALEIMVPTPGIRNLIREDKIHQIYSAMQTGQEKMGMQTMNQSLATLYQKKQVTLETALKASSNRDELQDLINRGVGVVAGAGLGRAGHAPRGATAAVGVQRSTVESRTNGDFCIQRTDARRADRDRRARRGLDGRARSRRCAASRSSSRRSTRSKKPPRPPAEGVKAQEGRGRRTWRSSPVSSR